MTNAPGTEEAQFVGNHLRWPDAGYDPSDAPHHLEVIRQRLRGRPPFETKLNGFCMLARTFTWWAGAVDSGKVFKPYVQFNSKGYVNRTPAMRPASHERLRQIRIWRSCSWPRRPTKDCSSPGQPGHVSPGASITGPELVFGQRPVRLRWRTAHFTIRSCLSPGQPGGPTAC